MRSRGSLLGTLLITLVAVGCTDDVDPKRAEGGGGAAAGGANGEGGVGEGGGGGQAAQPQVQIISVSDDSTSEHEPQLIVAGERIVATWNAFNADPTNFYHVEYRVSDDLGASWGPVISIPLADDNNIGSNTTLAATEDGTVYFAFATEYVNQQGVRSAQRVWLTSLAPGESEFGAPLELTDPEDVVGVYDQPAITVTTAGDLLVTYGEAPPDLQTTTLVTRRSEDGGVTWTKDVPIETGGPQYMNLFHPCVAPDSDRVYLLYLDADLGVALWRSEDGGKTFPAEQRVAVAGDDESPAMMVDGNCVAQGDEVWAIYGIAGNPWGTGGNVPRLDGIAIAHSSDGGATFDWRSRVEDTAVGPHYLLPRMAGAGDVIDISYYEGEKQGDEAASYRHARSLDGGKTFGPSEVVYEPVLYDLRRTTEQWLGDYMGVQTIDGDVVGVFVDNSAAEAH
ncbi:MAG: exo-alpha-sialidase, partial [Myxococcales bacterium]|nr:exo-alpha-sialidase [Myxococcales bacterium]